jgi:PPOX class probable FMN-dependent enzyme
MDEATAPPWSALLDAAVRSGAAQPAAPYAQLATLRPDGRPANRTVVVRGLLEPGSRPLVTTDARSAKAGQLAARPWAELCWFFPETREQFRLLGRVTLIGPDAADPDLAAARARTWEALSEPSRRSFAWPPPGAPRAAPSAFETRTPTDPPAWFTILVLDPEQVDHLDLKTDPHARTVFRREGGGWTAEPVNP